MPIDGGYKRSGRSMLDFIEAAARKATITREEFTRIRRYGSEEELIDAIERMNAAGGYDNLD